MSYDNDYDVIHNNDDYYVNQNDEDEGEDYWDDDIDEEDTDILDDIIRTLEGYSNSDDEPTDWRDNDPYTEMYNLYNEEDDDDEDENIVDDID